MSWVDFLIVGLIVLSALVSLVRGFVREALSLVTWILAFWIGFGFAPPLAVYFADLISVPSLQLAAAFLVLFLVTLALGAWVNFLLFKFVQKTGLGGTDRVVGVLFGAARGVVVVVVLVMLAGLTPLPQDGWWSASLLLPSFEGLALWSSGLLPEAIADSLGY